MKYLPEAWSQEKEPELAVEREMREETGLQPRKVERLGGFYSSPGFSTEYLYLFLATDMIENPLVTIPWNYYCDRFETEIPKLIVSGAICDSKSIAGLYSYFHYLQQIKPIKS